MKILESVTGLGTGGESRVVYDYCSRMLPDFKIDFIVVTDKEGILEKPLVDKGGTIFHVPKIRNGLFRYLREVKKIIKSGNYDIVHAHGHYKALYILLIAKFYHVKTRIVHSHYAYIEESLSQRLVRHILTPIVKYLSTDLYACSKDAGEWMWGSRLYKAGKIHVMKNAIESNRFIFSQNDRDRIRKALKWENAFVVGSVLRFDEQKNPLFIIDIFKALIQSNNNARLLLVGGGGSLEDEVHKKVKKLGLDKYVKFTGRQSCIESYLSTMDVFLLPSLFEGLGVVFIEAQANGLHCFASAEGVPIEANICNDITFISLQSSCEKWADQILHAPQRLKNSRVSDIIVAGYDIDNAVCIQKKEYAELVRNHRQQ